MKTFRFATIAIAFVAVGGLALWRSASRELRTASREAAGSHERAHPAGDGQPDSAQGTPMISPQIPALPADSKTSPHPVTRAVADGTVLETRFEPGPTHGVWTRLRLVQTGVQPRPVRVVEEWKQAPGNGGWIRQRCDMYLADQLIIKTPSGVSAQQLQQKLTPLGLAVEAQVTAGLFTVRLPKAGLDAAPAGLRLLTAHPEIAEAAEIDGVGFGGGVPNDPFFAQQWGLHNTGQSGGTADADVDAPEFWDLLDGTPGMVIAVLDSGLNLAHPDLQNIAWTNPGEIAGDGIDNDGNGRIDDVNGWDFVNSDNDPTDDHGHGSNVTGIIAATRNNGQGIAGLINGVHIVVCKILNSSNGGTTSNLIAATTYARLRGVPVMNLSLQNYPFSSSLSDEFTACQNAGILLCICAGNQGVNNDTTPNYPSSYPHANIIAVGNHDRTDARWAGEFGPSNYGLTAVDLFAPGREILSPVLGTDYSYYTGTSQATPFVTAIATALKYLNPAWKAPEIKNRILSSVVALPNYNGICVTGGRLNAVTAFAKASQTITFGTLANKTYGDAPFPVSATTSSGLTPTFAIVSGPASLNGNSVTLSGAGTVVIRASQPGNLTYYAAPDVDRSFAVANANGAPVITTQPASQTVLVGHSVTFSAAALGTPSPTYQWKKNGSNIAGATSSTLNLSNVQLAAAGNYTMQATNNAGTAVSNGAVLTVNSTSAAANPRADFDGDGRTELVWRNTNTTQISSWTAAGGYLNFGSESGGWSVAGIGDFDGDGKTEPLWRNSISAQVACWTMAGTYLNFGPESGGWQVLNAGDFDGDGRSEPLWHNTISTQVSAWTSSGTYFNFGPESGGWQVFATGDFDGDGRTEPLWRNTISAQIACWTMAGMYLNFGPESGGWAVIDVGDFDGDGRAEPLWHNTISTQVSAWTMAGTYRNFGPESGGWAVIDVGDYDGDGRTEPLWRNSIGNQISAWTAAGGFLNFGPESGGWAVIRF